MRSSLSRWPSAARRWGVVMVLTAMAGVPIWAQTSAWENLHLYGGAGRQLVVDPQDPAHLLLAVGSWGQYSYVSTNAGLEWQRLSINGGTVVYDPNAQQVVYLGHYRSADNGQTWTALDALVALNAEVQVVQPGNSQILFALGPGNNPAVLYRSADGGATWTNVTPAGVTAARWANTGRPIAFDPIDPAMMYVALERNPNVVADDCGVYKSTNGGLAWSRKDTNQAASIIVHPLDRSRLLAVGGAYESPVRHSADTGETWQVTGPMSDILFYQPGAPDTVYTIGNGCALSTNFGLTWSDWFLQGQIGFDCDAVIPAAASSNIFICQFDYGFFRVNADLSGLEERNNGIMELSVTAALLRNLDTHIVIGTERGVSVSFDGAASWRHYIGTAPGGTGPLLNQVAGLCFGYDTTQTVWAVGEGVNFSRDGGLTWSRAMTNIIGPQITSFAAVVYTAVAAIPDDSQRIWVGAYDEQGPADRSAAGLFYSTNNCDSLVQTPLFSGYVNCVVAESDAAYAARVPVPTSPARLMYAGVGYLTDSGVRGLYRSEDSGQSWTLRGLAGKKVNALALDGNDAQVVYASFTDATNTVQPYQLQRSDDGGQTWTNIMPAESTTLALADDPFAATASSGHRIPPNMRIVFLAAARTNSGEVYAAGLNDQNIGFILQSLNFGQTWTLLAGFLERLHVLAAGSLYGAMDGGFYKYLPAAESFNRAADFDGDRKADPAVYSGTNWVIWMSSVGYTHQGPFPFGVAGATPLAGDFDGDRQADPAVYTTNSQWYVWMSSAGYTPLGPFPFSVSGATPAPADFDGDGLADPAMFLDGYWVIWMSSVGYVPVGPFTFGYPSTTPVPADYDGDGKADPAVFANGYWLIWMSASGYQALGPLQFGIPDTIPVPADYDNDSKADPAVIFQSQWYIWMSSLSYALTGPFTFAE